MTHALRQRNPRIRSETYVAKAPSEALPVCTCTKLVRESATRGSSHNSSGWSKRRTPWKISGAQEISDESYDVMQIPSIEIIK